MTWCYGLWWGGRDFGIPGNEDLERFSSEERAREALLSRRHGNGKTFEHFWYMRRPAASVRLTGVTDDSEILLFADLGGSPADLTQDADLTEPIRRVYLDADGKAQIGKPVRDWRRR